MSNMEENNLLKNIANMLDGRQYLNEITDEECKYLEEQGIVAVFGYSDDNVELRGAVDDEVGLFEDGFVIVSKDGSVRTAGMYSSKACVKDGEAKIAAYHGIWRFETDVPHEEFTVYEDEDVFGKGIVFYLKNCC